MPSYRLAAQTGTQFARSRLSACPTTVGSRETGVLSRTRSFLMQNKHSADSIRAIVYEVVMEPEWAPSCSLIGQRVEEDNLFHLGGSIKWQIGAMVLAVLNPERHDPAASRLLMLPDVAEALNPVVEEVRQRWEEKADGGGNSCGETQECL